MFINRTIHIVLSYMTYKIRGHTPSNPTFYYDPAKKTEHNRFDGTSSYSVTAIYLESLISAYRDHIRTHFFYIYSINQVSFFFADNSFLRLNIVYSFDFNYVVVIVLIFKHF